MARKKEKGGGEKIKKQSLKSETVQAIISVVSFAAALFLTLAAFGKGGVMGDVTFHWLSILLGVGYFLFPLILVMFSIATLKAIHNEFSIVKLIGAIIFSLAGLGMVSMIFTGRGGIIGNVLSTPILTLFGFGAGMLILFAILIVCTLIVFDTGINLARLFALIKRLFGGKKVEELKENSDEEDESDEVEESEENLPEEKPEKEVRVHTGVSTKKDLGDENFAVNQKYRPMIRKFVPIP